MQEPYAVGVSVGVGDEASALHSGHETTALVFLGVFTVALLALAVVYLVLKAALDVAMQMFWFAVQYGMCKAAEQAIGRHWPHMTLARLPNETLVTIASCTLLIVILTWLAKRGHCVSQLRDPGQHRSGVRQLPYAVGLFVLQTILFAGGFVVCSIAWKFADLFYRPFFAKLSNLQK
jgi:hypothetical protein